MTLFMGPVPIGPIFKKVFCINQMGYQTQMSEQKTYQG